MIRSNGLGFAASLSKALDTNVSSDPLSRRPSVVENLPRRGDVNRNDL